MEEELVLSRFSSKRPTRKTQLKLLESFGLSIPRFGSVLELANRLIQDKSTEVIGYPKNQISLGSEKLKLAEAIEIYPLEFAVEYIVNDDRSNVGRCIRCIYCNQHILLYEVRNGIDEQFSNGIEQWRAGKVIGDGILNLNQSKVEIITSNYQRQLSLTKEINSMYPIYQCDLVKRNDQMFAVNFNPAPLLGSTNIANSIPAKEMAKFVAASLIKSVKNNVMTLVV